jgi:hypothetical protein
MLLLVVKTFAQTEVIDFPDPAFKHALVNDNVVDTNGDFIPDSDADLNNDGLIDLEEALSVTYLNLYYFDLSSSEKIKDLEGIQHFQNLEWLDIEFNEVSSIEVLNQLQKLWWLDADSNTISSVNFSENESLEYLFLGANDLTALDVSMISNLKRLGCSQNSLNTLNIQNGNNTELIEVTATGNPDLNCVQVDDVGYALSQTCNETAETGFCVDSNVTFNTNCTLSLVSPEALRITVYPNPTSSQLTIGSVQPVESVSVYTLRGQKVLEKCKTSVIDLTSLKAGMYLITINTNYRSECFKVVKE